MAHGRRPQGESGPGLSEATLQTPHVRFVLVGTRAGGNVGAAARALKNLGFRRIDLVSPECDPRGEEARRMAVDAADLLDSLRVHPNLDAALLGAGIVVGTTSRKGKQRSPHFRLDEFARELRRLASVGALAIVFGREARGLTDTELDRCTHLVHIFASEEYPSFNLAQAVLLVAYELRLALLGDPLAEARHATADHSAREAMYAHLERALRAIGFLYEDTAPGMMRRIRRMLGRATLTPGDVQILRGFARQTLWLARHAGLAVSDGDPTDDEGGRTPPGSACDTEE